MPAKIRRIFFHRMGISTRFLWVFIPIFRPNILKFARFHHLFSSSREAFDPDNRMAGHKDMITEQVSHDGITGRTDGKTEIRLQNRSAEIGKPAAG